VRQPEPAARDRIERERDRVVHRIGSMPIGRLDAATRESVRVSAQRIVDLTPDPDRPPGTQLPPVGASAAAAQLSLVVQDYLDMRTAASDDAAVAEVAEILTQLRRSLP